MENPELPKLPGNPEPGEPRKDEGMRAVREVLEMTDDVEGCASRLQIAEIFWGHSCNPAWVREMGSTVIDLAISDKIIEALDAGDEERANYFERVGAALQEKRFSVSFLGSLV